MPQARCYNIPDARGGAPFWGGAGAAGGSGGAPGTGMPGLSMYLY